MTSLPPWLLLSVSVTHHHGLSSLSLSPNTMASPLSLSPITRASPLCNCHPASETEAVGQKQRPKGSEGELHFLKTSINALHRLPQGQSRNPNGNPRHLGLSPQHTKPGIHVCPSSSEIPINTKYKTTKWSDQPQGNIEEKAVRSPVWQGRRWGR